MRTKVSKPVPQDTKKATLGALPSSAQVEITVVGQNKELKAVVFDGSW
jgi:hypothetical protein